MTNYNLLIWNAKGLNNKAWRDMFRSVVDSCHPFIVCIQETKMDFISKIDVISILGAEFDKLCFLLAQTTRGVILIAWKSSIVMSDIHYVDPHSVLVLFLP